MERSLEQLPIDSLLAEIARQLQQDKRSLVLKAEPGAGKTTRVAPYLLDQVLRESDQRIYMLEPRRVAARAAAERMSLERGGRVGDEIGYQVRHERKISKSTRIITTTTGLYLRKIQEDPTLEGVAMVVFDEFHERSLDLDLALALTKQVKKELRDELYILVMSATLEAAPISAYLNNCPTLECPGRTHPVRVSYLSRAPLDNLEDTVAKNTLALLPKSEGHILVFLPGLGEIRRTQNLLEDHLRDLSASRLQSQGKSEQVEQVRQFEQSGQSGQVEQLRVLPLYGELSLEEQQAVLNPIEPAKENQSLRLEANSRLPVQVRKIILATNVAETSLTIEGVRTVIDSGLCRLNQFEPLFGLNRLETTRISKASATQRAGRAGRTTSGDCLRLYSEKDYNLLPDFERPEIERVDLAEAVLQLLAWGEKDPRKFDWFEKPAEKAIESAMNALKLLGAIDDKENLTDIGKEMARLPLQPRLARLIIACLNSKPSASNQLLYLISICAALLSEKDPFKRSKERQPAKHKSHSDLLDRAHALIEFETTKERYPLVGGVEELLGGAARQVLRVAKDLFSLACTSKAQVTPALPDQEEDLTAMKILLAAFPDRVCRLRPGERRALMTGGRGVKLSEESALHDSEFFLALELIDLGQAETLVRQASHIERSWLEAKAKQETEVFFDHSKNRIVAVSRVRYLDLVLEERPVALPKSTENLGALLLAGLLKKYTLRDLLDEDSHSYICRLACLKQWLPELDLPDIEPNNLPPSLVEEWLYGLTSLEELRGRKLIDVVKARLNREQLRAIDAEAPEKITVPSGSSIKISYEIGKDPVLAVRIQEVYGLAETPRLARGRQPVLMHLLAPNYRIQQITPDLKSFWQNTYPDVKKDLKARYPKHSWPDDPLVAQAISGTKRREKK
ncbi:MAG: DEAD/DEAH box helicase [Candidatus Obscuribacterales bacterium]|nr:DEAD/DEAH box helicase [Candidatus Obscuribacterales bacterium]